MTIDPISATAETFEPFLKQSFQIQTESGPIEVILDNIKIYENSGVRDSHLEIDNRVYPIRQAFALTFEGPREPTLVSQMYKITHPETGMLELFISGFRQDHSCMLYESIFN
jgi:hypothetical protein